MRKQATLGLLVKSLLFMMAVFAAYSQFTDADLFDQEGVSGNSFVATTLDFSTLDTANQTNKTLFFSVNGMVPTGFQIESVRLKNSGNLEFPYSVSVAQTAGSAPLCQNLDLVVLQEWTPIYTGKLLELQLAGELAAQENWEDLVFVVKFNNTDGALKNQTCSFIFTFTTALTGNSFSDTETLENTISTGAWAE